MLEQARRRLGDDADLQVAELGRPLPFPGGVFDDVIAALSPRPASGSPSSANRTRYPKPASCSPDELAARPSFFCFLFFVLHAEVPF